MESEIPVVCLALLSCHLLWLDMIGPTMRYSSHGVMSEGACSHRSSMIKCLTTVTSGRHTDRIQPPQQSASLNPMGVIVRINPPPPVSQSSSSLPFSNEPVLSPSRSSSSDEQPPSSVSSAPTVAAAPPLNLPPQKKKKKKGFSTLVSSSADGDVFMVRPGTARRGPETWALYRPADHPQPFVEPAARAACL